MQLQTYTALTMADALRQVKAALGNDAVILHTRTYQRRIWLGLRRRGVVEITACRASDDRQRLPASSAGRAPFAVKRAQPQRLMETPAATSAVMLGLSQEVSGLKSVVMDLVRHSRTQAAADVPEDLRDCYGQLLQVHIAPEMAAQVVGALHQQLSPAQRQNPAARAQALLACLQKLLTTSGPIVRSKESGPHVVALIGPTGVGKTTTIAKLAANLRLRQRRRVGLITIDTYRIAAVDQLRKYADIIGAPLRVVNRPQDLRQAVSAMTDCEFVLIDTAGRSPTDSLKLSELKLFLEAAEPDEVHLVLSATASQDCMEAALSRFGEVRADKIIFTKLDEAVHIGGVLNIVHKLGRGISYVTTGQDVPDDIEVAQPAYLAQRLLNNSAASAREAI